VTTTFCGNKKGDRNFNKKLIENGQFLRVFKKTLKTIVDKLKD